MNFITGCFKEPPIRTLRLLFRASEHNFSADEFHRYCDGVPHTLVLVRSEQGKNFGGYTPLPWKSRNFEWEEDASGRSFLFSVDKRERFALTQPKKSSYHYKDCGPAFGGGSDLVLGDNCGARDDAAGCDFPTSYSGNGKYQRNEATWRELFGATTEVNGRKSLLFRVA